MHDSVRGAFRQTSELLEGLVHEMYVDVVGLVTVSVGNLIDASRNPAMAPWEPALLWEWRHKDTGAVAAPDEVIAEWQRVKSAGHNNWLARAQASFGKLAMMDAEIDRLFAWRLDGDEKIYRQRFPEWDAMCADAQFATALYGWGRGASFHKEELVNAIACAEWEIAADHGQWSGFNANRNAAIKGHFLAAARVGDGALDPAQLHYRFAG